MIMSEFVINSLHGEAMLREFATDLIQKFVDRFYIYGELPEEKARRDY